MKFFENLEEAPPDALFGLNQAFLADPRGQKVNLGIGTYKTSDLKPLVLSTVKKAEEELIVEEMSKDYLPIDGDPVFRKAVAALVFGRELSEGLEVVQTVGGTAALRLGATFLAQNGFDQFYLPEPTWDNHRRIFRHAGGHIHTYPYYNRKERHFDFGAMRGAIEKFPKRSVLVLHASCHNPTGCDPSPREWEEVLSLIEKKGIFPFFDCAYQGFGDGLEQDVFPLRHMAQLGMQGMIAYSFSKNFGLYAERVGALLTLSHGGLASHLKLLVRGMYSNPPCHGARIVSKILNSSDLRNKWEQELSAMRERIGSMRSALLGALKSKTAGGRQSFDLIGTQRGMFSYTGLDEDQVGRLIGDFGIYLPKDGRINVAGLNTENLDYVADAIASVSHYAKYQK